jgi:hypothetical protein
MKMFTKNSSGDSAAPKSILSWAALVALAVGVGLSPTPAAAQVTAGDTGSGVTVTQVNQQVTVQNPVTFGPDGGFTASIESGDLTLTANGLNQLDDVTFGAPPDQLNDLSLDEPIGGTQETEGTEYNTASLEGAVYYGLETYQDEVDFNLAAFVAENQGWVEIDYDEDPITVVEYGLAAIPEPASLSLFAIGVLAVLRRHRRKQAAAV